MMDTIEYRTADKSGWPQRGEWDNEPDKKQWQDGATGLPCLAVRGPGGHWCGYVGVPEGHRFYQRDYDDVHVDVHGGLTYSAFCATGDEQSNICHRPAEGEPDHVWWLGFDCAHLGDASPKWDRERRHSDFAETYKTLAYVERECASLAKQFVEAA